ncbi:MAG TPA: ATP-binding protein [Dermatophilaceae bacterium]|nr:ATP-binding protein [Dermatophilaceae bacterium]
MHSVLLRQLGRLNLSETQPPDLAAWNELLRLVGAAYCGHDQDRYLLERAMTLSSAEMRALHVTLRRDRERLAAVIHSLDKGLIVLDQSLQVEFANPEAARIVGVSPQELEAWTVKDLQRCAGGDPALAAVFDELAASTAEGSLARQKCDDAWLRSADGRAVPVSAGVMPVHHEGRVHGAVVVLGDVSERQSLELELRQAQKLEAVGRLAAGVAHEINTPMQFVADNLRFIDCSASSLLGVLAAGQSLTEAARGDDRTRALADAIEACDPEFLTEELAEALTHSRDGVERVTSIVRAMKSFSHPGSVSPCPADLNKALQDSVTVARGEFRGVADVDLQLGDVPHVVCLVHDLKQVFLNLVINASHAIADRAKVLPGQGTITVTSSRRGDWVVITIGDDGTGIPDDVADHIFEPFFTTKQVGRGSGQGLALAHSVIVDGHRGRLTFTSQVGVGTTFEIELPIRDA